MTNLRCDLIDAGLLIGTGVDGIVGRGAVFDDVVARLGAVDVKGAGERVVAFDHRHCVAWFFDGVAEAVEGVRIKDVGGL